MKNTVSIDEFRTNLAQLIGKVMYAKDQVIIKKYNRDAAILLSLEEYEKLIDPTKRLSQARWKGKFEAIDRIRESMPEVEPKLIEKEVAKAIKEVRAQKQNNL